MNSPDSPNAEVALGDVLQRAGVRHLRCPNAGPMTLSGTNTYVLQAASARRRVFVIDPGSPSDGDVAIRDYLTALAQTVCAMLRVSSDGEAPAKTSFRRDTDDRDGDVHVDILVTHHHADHLGGVAEFVEQLRQEWGAQRQASGETSANIGGESDSPTLHINVFGAGQRPFDDLEPGMTDGELRVIETPGHTADSVSFLWRRGDDSVLFTGDTILGGSSSFIAHPDGNLAQYLRSLEALVRVLQSSDGEGGPSASGRVVLAPGHGALSDDALAAIRGYQKHRAERLDEVRAALASLKADDSSRGSRRDRVDAVILYVYPEIGEQLRPAVEAVVAAQLEYLDGRDAVEGEDN